MELTEKQKEIIAGKTCPYCSAKTEFTDSSIIYGKSYGMVYICRPCNAWVGVHKGTEQALGRLANYELRKAKNAAHFYFDQIWKNKHMKRSAAYEWLSLHLGIPREYTHIGMFGVKTCNEVVRISREYLEGR